MLIEKRRIDKLFIAFYIVMAIVMIFFRDYYVYLLVSLMSMIACSVIMDINIKMLLNDNYAKLSKQSYNNLAVYFIVILISAYFALYIGIVVSGFTMIIYRKIVLNKFKRIEKVGE